MIFDEYNEACKRHVQACESLLRDMKEYSEKKQKRILQEAYYLAGYIFECIYKYAIYALIEYDPKESVNDLNKDGLTFKKHIKKHDFSILRDELDTRIGGNIPFIKTKEGIEKEIIDLYEKWDPKFRYEANPAVNEEKVRRFLYWGKKTRDEILSNI